VIPTPIVDAVRKANGVSTNAYPAMRKIAQQLERDRARLIELAHDLDMFADDDAHEAILKTLSSLEAK